MLGLGNSVTLSSTRAHEQMYSVTFDGTGDYIALPIAIKRTTGSLSIWFKTSETGNQTLIGAGDKDSADNFWTIAFGDALTSGFADEVMEWTCRIDGAPSVVQATFRSATPGLFRDGNWHNIVLTVSGSANLIYMDGTVLASGSAQEQLNYQQGSTSTGNILLSTSDFDSVGIGRRFVPSSPLNWNGNADEMAIWSSVLDADAVAAVYNSGKPFDLTSDRGNYDVSGDLVNYWRLNDGSGTTVVDPVGGNDGTLSADKLGANTILGNHITVGSRLTLNDSGFFNTTAKASYTEDDAGFFLGYDVDEFIDVALDSFLIN